MSENATINPKYPVGFNFLVEFQSKRERFQASFSQVSGLHMQFQTSSRSADTRAWIKLPHSLTYGNITLKRVVEVNVQDKFTKWINTNFNADTDDYIKVFDVIIKLLDENGMPLAAWQCAAAFPTDWSLSTLESEKSILAMETVVLTCNRIGRLTV